MTGLVNTFPTNNASATTDSRDWMDASSERWKPAVTALVEELGSLNSAGRDARQAFKGLLWSEQPELQLRALFGIELLSRVDSELVADFVQASWQDPSVQRDPVKLYQLAKCCREMTADSLASLLDIAWNDPSLPLDIALSTIELVASLCLKNGEVTLLEQMISHDEEQVRARVAMELLEQVDFEGLPAGLAQTLREGLTRLSADPVREVRASMASVLAFKLMSPPNAPVAQSAFLRQLAELMAADADDQVRSMLRSVQLGSSNTDYSSPEESLVLADQLSKEPENSLAGLAPWMRTAGSFHRLKLIGDFSSSAEVSATAHALGALVSDEAEFSERLLGCIGYLRNFGSEKSLARQQVLVELKELAKLCLALIEAPSLLELSNWATTTLEASDTPDFSHLDVDDFFQLLEILSIWRDKGPQWLRSELQQLLARSDQHLLPERELIEPVLRHLAEVVSDEWENSLDDSI